MEPPSIMVSDAPRRNEASPAGERRGRRWEERKAARKRAQRSREGGQGRFCWSSWSMLKSKERGGILELGTTDGRTVSGKRSK